MRWERSTLGALQQQQHTDLEHCDGVVLSVSKDAFYVFEWPRVCHFVRLREGRGAGRGWGKRENNV